MKTVFKNERKQKSPRGKSLKLKTPLLQFSAAAVVVKTAVLRRSEQRLRKSPKLERSLRVTKRTKEETARVTVRLSRNHIHKEKRSSETHN